MPLMSKTFTTVSNFILSLILPSKDEGLMGLLVGRFFGNIWEGICNIFYFICKWFLAFMDFLQYFIQKLVGLDYWLDSNLTNQRTLGGAMNDDMIFKFLYADSIQKVFRALCALFLILLIVFTIFAIVKSEWDYMVGDGSKGNSKAAVMRSMMKSIVLVAVFPILLIMGIVSSNAILASIIKAVGVDMSDTFGGKIFSIAAKSANKHRHYVEANTYLPTSDKVDFYLKGNTGELVKLYVFGDKSTCDHSNCNTYHEHFTSYTDYLKATQRAHHKLSINSVFDPLVPVHLDTFSGFCFRIDDENGNYEYYFVQANSKTKWTVYYYLTRVLDAKVLAKGGVYASSEERADSNNIEDTLRKELTFNAFDCDGSYISGFSMKKASDVARTVCRNSWNYSLIYAKPGKSLSQSLASQPQPLKRYDLGSTGEGSILYNSHEISKYFDGGQFGVVQSRTEYAVMADVIDFMCDNNLTFYIMDATSSQINWNHNYTLDKTGAGATKYIVEDTWISSKLAAEISEAGSRSYFIDTAAKKTPEKFNEHASTSESVATMIYDYDEATNNADPENIGALTFLTSYSDTRTLAAEYENDVIYTARFDVNDESKGSRYIICLKEEGQEAFYPLVNGEKFGIGDREYTFKSDYYSSDYKGVVWAKGAFDTNTIDGVYGNPTFLKGTSLTAIGDDEVVTDADGAYYYDISDDGKTLKLYNAYTRQLSFVDYTKNYLATYNNGSLYRAGSNSLSMTNNINTSNWLASSITLEIDTHKYKSKYVLTSKRQVTIGGSSYQIFASEDEGFCYALFVASDGKVYKPKNESGSMVPDSEYSGGPLEVCYIGESSARVASDLTVRTVKIADSSHDLFLGAGHNSQLKTKFSAFVVPSGATSEEGGEYFGTFTKPLVEKIETLTELSSETKTLETYWGSKYYSIQTVGKCYAGIEGSLSVTGKFNVYLEFDITSAVGTMMSYYESAQTADAVSCCRYQIENFSGNSFGSTLIEFNWELWKGIFELKFGTVQQVSKSVNVSHTFIYLGENSGITFDYFFDQNVELRTFYAASKIQYFVLLMSAIMIIKVLFNALWGVIKRFYMITLYYLAMPVAASTIPIDDGKRFSDVRERIIGEVLSTYGVLIGLNVFFVLLAPIREITSTIFTDAAIANSGSYFLKNLNIKAEALNELVYILFLIVAFTLIGELPSFVQDLVGKGKGVDATGSQMKDDVGKTLKSTGNVISGQAVIDTLKKGKEIVPGLLPGSALVGKVGKGIGEFRKNFGEGYKKGRGGEEKEEKSNSRESEDNEFENQRSSGGGSVHSGGGSQGGGNQGGGVQNNRETEDEVEENKNPLDDVGAEEAGAMGAEDAGSMTPLGIVGMVAKTAVKKVANFGRQIGNAVMDGLELGVVGYRDGEMAPGSGVENESFGEDINAQDGQNQIEDKGVNSGSIDAAIDKVKNGEVDLSNLAGQYNVDVELIRSIVIEELQKLKGELSGAGSEADAQDKADAQRQIQELDNANKINENELDNETNAELSELEENSKLVVGDGEVSSEVEALDALNESDNDGRFAGLRKKFKESGLFSPLQAAKDKLHGIKDSKAVRVAKGLLGLDKETTKGAFLGLAGKSLKAVGLLAIAATPALGGVVGAAVLAGGMFGVTKIGKKALEAGKKFRNADEATKAKIITKYGNMFLKSAAVATIGLATGGLGFAAVAGGGSMAALLVKDKKYRSAHPEANILANAKMKEPLVALSEENRERRQQIVQAAVGNMTDARRAQFAKDVSNANIKLDGKKVSVNVGAGGALQYTVGSGKNARVLDANNVQDAKEIKRIESRAYATLNESERKDAVRNLKLEEKADTVSSSVRVRQAAIVDKALQLNNGELTFGKNGDKVSYNSASKTYAINGVQVTDPAQIAKMKANVFANMSTEDKKKALTDIKRQEKTDEINAGKDAKKAEIAERAILGMSAEDLNKILATIHTFDSGSKDPVSSKASAVSFENGEFKVNGETATPEQMSKITAGIYEGLTNEQKTDALVEINKEGVDTIVSALDEQRVRAISREEAEKLINQLDDDVVINDAQIYRESESELAELNLDAEGEADSYAVSSEVEALDALNESDKDKKKGIKDWKAVRVAKGLLGLDKDTTKGAFLGLAGKSLKSIGLLAIAATPALGGVVGAMALAGGMFGVTKIGKKALEAGKKFRNADEATKAKIITKYGNMFLKSAAVATIGLATGGLGFAAIAGGGSMAALLVKDKKYRIAHPEANILANAKMKEPLVALTEENRERRQQIVQAAVGNMTDARRSQFAESVNKANIKLDGKKVSVSVGAGGALQYTVGSGKNARVLDANNAQDAKEIKRIESRMFSVLSTDEKRAVLVNESKSVSAAERQAVKNDRKGSVAEKAVNMMNETRKNQFQTAFNAAGIQVNGNDVKFEQGEYKVTEGGKVRSATADELAKINLQVYSSNNLLSKEEKIRALAKLNKETLQQRNETSRTQQKDRIAQLALSTMSAEEVNSVLGSVNVNGAKVTLSNNGTYLVNGKTATDEQTSKINAEVYNNLTSAQKVNAVMSLRGKGDVDEARMIKVAEQVVARYMGGAQVGATATNVDVDTRDRYFSYSKEEININQASNYDVNKQVNFTENGKYEVNGKKVTNRQAKAINNQIFDKLSDAERVEAIAKTNKVSSLQIANNAIYLMTDETRRDNLLKSVNLGDNKKVSVDDEGNYLVDGQKATKTEITEINKQVYSNLTENEKLDALYPMNNASRAEVARTAMKTLDETRKDAILTDIDLEQIDGLGEKKKKHPKLRAFLNAVFGYEKNTVKGAAIGVAGKFVGLAGVAGAAGASIMLASPLGLLGVGLATGSFLAGKKIRDKFVTTRARRKKMSEAERAQYITRWGGNILKTTMGAALGLATGGIGFALAGGVTTAGILFAKNRKANRASTKVHNSLSNSYSDTEVYETSSVSRPSYSVTGIQSAEQTKQMLVNDNSFVARLTQEVINSGRLLDDKEKMQVTRHYVNYGAIVDTTFVPDISLAYKNVVANSVGTRGGRSIVADAINNFASSNNMTLSQAIVEQGGLLSVESKVALYKSMMNEDQLNSYNLYMSRDEKKSALEQLNFIQNNVSGLGMTLGVGYDKNKGITFNVNGQEVKDLKGQKTEKTNSVNMALRQMLSSDKITNADIATSISNTNTSDYITKAVAQNYALTLDYSNEIINNTTENIYHQEVLERAKANADINAEAILKYLKNNTELFEQFRQEYGEANTKTNEDMLATIKMATDPRNVVPGSMFNNIKVSDYAKELSEVTARHVEDGSFKVQSFDLLPRALQMDVADRLVANLTAIYAGKAYGLTDNERKVEINLSESQFGGSDLIYSFLNSNLEDKDEIVNKLVARYYGFTDEKSPEAQKLLNEIGATKIDELQKDKGITLNDALIAYAKAKMLGKANEFESFIGKNDHDVKVFETMMRGGKLEAKELKTFSDQEFVETVLQTAKDKNDVINQMVISSAGLTTNSQGNIDVTSDRYLSLVEEMLDNKVWAKALEGKELESEETRNVVLGYAKAKVLGKTNSKDISAYVSGGNDEVNKNVISEFTKVSSSADIHRLREIRYDYGTLSDAEVKEMAQALKYQEDLMNNLKTAFGYKEGGDAKTNSAAERAMRDFINSNGTKLDVLKYDGVKVNKTQFDKIRAEAFTFDEKTGRTKAQDNVELAERAKTIENIKELAEYQNNNQTRVEVERQITAYEAIENLKKSYLTGQGNMSALKDAFQGNIKAEEMEKYLKLELSIEQIAKLVKDGSENAYSTLSVGEQNSILPKLALQDKGAVKVLVNNNVDVKSLQAIAEFLNSGAGSALKERLISTVSSSLLTLNATRLGFDERQIFDLVRSVETRGSNAALYEMAQGDLISNRQVKEQLAHISGSENTEQILQNAANKFELLTESEIEKIRQKVKEKPENKDLTETQLNSRVFWSILEAKMNMLSNGGLERQRKVSEVIWGNSTLRKLAQENFKNNKDINPNNAELENISEVDRNNFLFANYKNFAAKGSEERQIIENEINKHKINYENKVDNKKAIESMSQSEFDSIIKEMNESGTKIISDAKRQIIEKLNQDNRLTEIPDRTKMSKAEESEYDEMVSVLQQRYRSGKSEEEFANLVRMSRPVNDGEIVRQILAGNNQSATSKEINAAKVETLKKNQEFDNNAVVSVMSMKENAEILNKIIAKLKSEGVEYKKLSVVEKGESIKKLLGDETFTKTNKITSNQVDILNKAFGNKFIENTETATNYDIKMGMETKQIARFLSAHEKIRDRLIHLGAFNPHLFFGREKVYRAKTNYVLNYYHYRQIFMRTLMREMYTNPQLKKVIREEIVNPNSKAYMPELKRLTNAEVNRYINANLDKLAARVGEAKLLDKNENGRFEFKPEFKERSFEYERAMRRVESENPIIKKKVKKAMSAAIKAMFGYTTEKDKEIDLMMETLAQKAESSSSFKNIVEKITKRSIPNAFDEFLATGGGSQIINTQVDSRVDEKIKDVAYKNHNRPVKRERASLLAELRKWQNKLSK